MNEDFLVTMPYKELAAQRTKASNFVAAGVAIARQRIQALSAALKCGALTTEVRCSRWSVLGVEAVRGRALLCLRLDRELLGCVPA